MTFSLESIRKLREKSNCDHEFKYKFQLAEHQECIHCNITKGATSRPTWEMIDWLLGQYYELTKWRYYYLSEKNWRKWSDLYHQSMKDLQEWEERND